MKLALPHYGCLKKPKVLNIKQIMTGLEGNRQIYLPREIQDRLPKRSIEVNRNSWGGDPECQGANR